MGRIRMYTERDETYVLGLEGETRTNERDMWADCSRKSRHLVKDQFRGGGGVFPECVKVWKE